MWLFEFEIHLPTIDFHGTCLFYGEYIKQPTRILITAQLLLMTNSFEEHQLKEVNFKKTHRFFATKMDELKRYSNVYSTLYTLRIRFPPQSSGVILSTKKNTPASYRWTNSLLHCKVKGFLGYIYIYIYWVVPLPSNSDHQDYYMNLVGNPNLNLHFHYYWEGGPTQYIYIYINFSYLI